MKEASIRALVQSAWSLDVVAWEPIVNGDEASVWRIDTPRGAFVVHISPRWRTPAELRWVHAVIAFVGDVVPEAVAPTPVRSGATFAPFEGALVTLFPFVDGVTLDRDSDEQVIAAGRLLARVHRRLQAWPHGSRPAPGPNAPTVGSGAMPAELTDPALDAWWKSSRARNWTRGVIHGDYYRRNLLWASGRITGVVDWHDARSTRLASELAFAAWEFGHDAGMRFVPERARAFVDAYLGEQSPIEAWERDELVPLMRIGIRKSVLYEDQVTPRDGRADREYREKMVQAFRDMRHATC